MNANRSRFTRLALLAAVAAVPAVARAAEPDPSSSQPSISDLQAQIRQLQSKVEQLQTNQTQQSQLDRQAVDDTVRRVLEDSDKRSQFLQMEGFTAGYDKGKFVIQSPDGNFLLHPWFQFQFRSVTNYRTSGGGVDSDLENGFEIRRMKFGIDGNFINKDLTYFIDWATDRKTGTLGLEEAWARYKFADDWAVKGGQFKQYFAHESYVSTKKQMAADRSLLTDNFTGGDDYVQGVGLEYVPNAPLHAAVSFTDGAKNNINQNFQDFPTNNADWGVGGRVEYLVMGEFKDYEDFTARLTKKDLLVVGGAAEFSEAGDTDTFLHTVDVQYKNPSGLSLYGAAYGRATENSPAGAGAGVTSGTDNLYDWGVLAQASYAINEHWEPFVRYDYIKFDSDGLAAGAEDNVHEFTVGANYYIWEHAAKFTADLGWLPNGSPVADDGAGILASPNDEYYLRAQFQLLL